MKTKLVNLWYRFRSNFWFIPSVLAFSSIIIALGLVWLDYRLIVRGVHPAHEYWFLLVSPDGAQTFLSTIAGSMLGVTGVVFSITIVSLTVASGQFGPRLLREFMKDLGNQVVLGTFIACFLYCLIVLRYLNFGDSFKDGFVPYIAINGALLVSIAGLAVLIYFIHHVATAIQADTIVASLSENLQNNIDRLFPKQDSRYKNQKLTEPRPKNFEEKVLLIESPCSGYVQAIDYEGLSAMADDLDFVLKLHERAGKYVVRGSTLMSYISQTKLTEEATNKLVQTFVFGKQPTSEQDIEFSLSQIVEIAVRSLSPGINDPFTAISCIDVLSEGVRNIAERGIPPPYYCNKAGKLRLIFDALTFSGILDTAFNQIRQNTRSSVAVRIRLLEALASIAIDVTDEDAQNAIRKHAQMIKDGALREGLSEKHDLNDIEKRLVDLYRVLNKETS